MESKIHISHTMQTKKSLRTFNEKVTYWFGVVAIGMIIGLGLQFAQAWTNPTVSAPNGNVAGPITTGAVDQIKSAGLGLTGSLAVGNHVGWGTGGSILRSQGAMEIRWPSGTPYIDFADDTTSDYDMRLIWEGDDALRITGGNLNVSGKVTSNDTVDSDSGITLATKSYVDKKSSGALPVLTCKDYDASTMGWTKNSTHTGQQVCDGQWSGSWCLSAGDKNTADGYNATCNVDSTSWEDDRMRCCKVE